MEREVLIANTKTQKRYKLNTSATTLAELKNNLAAQGIDYDGMSFTEGISNTQLLDDQSQLPANLNYKGKVTNNLVIILTNTTKRIESGAVSAERAELFDFIKSHSLQDKVVAEFGKNMTQVKTDALKNFIHLYGNENAITPTSTGNDFDEDEKSDLDDMADDILAKHGFSNDEEKAEEEDEEGEEDEEVEDRNSDPTNVAIDAVEALVRHFSNKGILTGDDFDSLYDVIRDCLY